jgi:uncharacterized membrane protein YcaP (DUF421 family)
MQEFLHALFGQGEPLTTLQVAVRSFVMFLITLVLIRIGGLRIFGKKSAFDVIVSIMLGAILSRGIMGASPFWQTVASGFVLVLVHRLISLACIKSKRFAILVSGRPVILYKDGQYNWKNMTLHSLSENDLKESLRISTGLDRLDDIRTATLERSGKISFIKKQKEKG